MRKLFLTFSLVIMTVVLSSCTNSKKQAEDNTADKNETGMTSDDWISLFDGASFDGWRGYGREDMPTAWT